ncbi:putative manganese-dependent inorganic diphosphatase [Novisyntrophococcus fermenticellae]|uniref:putative manganese-dependent inorganic diphosphatase n=1 Tax=Novisyntrophococcus fermenticellae TaxID=2068655 RepID=UPI001E2915E3|nr:putative manganese-dependent inorganic diphosphatase [Novisyntrophococcus fermenticellae]
MKRENRVYVIGHRNPDTDSICSAIAYADIKNRTQNGNFVAKRAGQINGETEYVLNRFGVRVPGYLPDAGTQVKEIDIHEIKGVRGNISVKRAWERMREENVVTLPITSENQDLLGIITVSDIAKSYMDAYDSSVMSQAKTKYHSIAETLNGQVIVGNEHGYFVKGRVVIGSFHPDMMENYINKDDLVILGNRTEDQLCAIEMEASCLVVGLGAKISKSIQKLAEDHDCVIISSPHDTYTIARLINQSIPIKYLMTKENLITFSTNDFVDDIKEVMKIHRHRDFPIINKKNKYIGTISRRNLISNGRKKLILVDHNEKSQAVENIEEAEILEIIDHHRLGSIETIAPVLFRNQPVGCTATIMYQIYKEHNLKVPKNIAGLLCAAIISDTLMFRSPTCTAADKEAAKVLAQIAEIDIEKFATDMFRAGSNLKDKSPEEIFYQDFKKFNVEESTFGVGQINSMDGDELKNIKDQILPQLESECQKHGIPRVYFMLTNIIEESTELLFYGDGSRELVNQAFQPKQIDNNSAMLPGVVSRKKQLIPGFMLALQELQM